MKRKTRKNYYDPSVETGLDKSTFIGKLFTASKLTIRDGNRTIKVPVTVMQQARDMSLEIVSFDKNVTVDQILASPKKYDDLVEKTFHAYLEGYAESVIPASNPARHRGEAAMRVLDSFVSPQKGFFKEHFPSETNTERETRANVLKSGLFKVADIFIEGVAKINRSTTEDSQVLTRADIGMNFASGLKGKDAAAIILFNQYYFKTLIVWLYMLTSKLYELHDNEIRPYLMQKLQDRSIGELKDKEVAAQIFNEIKQRTARLLSGINLSDTLK